MPIKVTCPKCQGVLHAPDDAGGKRGKCPTCGMVLAIPDAGAGGSLIPPEPSLAPTPFNAAPAARASSAFPVTPEEGRRESFASGLTGAPGAQPGNGPAPARQGAAKRPGGASYGLAPEAPRKSADPFSKAGPRPATVPSEGTTRAWRRSRRGLGLVQFAYFLALVAVLAGVGVLVAPLLGANLPDKPGLMKVTGIDLATEILFAAFLVPLALALLFMTFGRLGAANAPCSSYARGLLQASALTTFLTLLGVIAVGAIIGWQLKEGYSPLMLMGDELPGIVQRVGIALAGVCAPIAELWFVIALGRMGAGLHDVRLARRGTNFLLLAGLVYVLVGLGVYAVSYYQAEINRAVAEQVTPKLTGLGDKRALVIPGLAILAGLFLWLLYLRLVGAARRAIADWLDVNRG